MSTIKPILYRVETYIVPEVNKFPPVNKVNEIDDFKLANRSKIVDENVPEDNKQNTEKDTLCPTQRKSLEYSRYSAQEHKHYRSINVEIKKDLPSMREATYNRQFNDDEENSCYFNGRPDVGETEYQASIRSQDTLYPARQFRRVNSLMSIDERSESSECSKLSDVCHHGYKNGCTAMIPSPERISEEVFQENWLQKIEILRQREAAVIARETSLQNKERLLFRREREIRITERILQDKLRQVEEELKQQQDTHRVERRLEEVGRILESDEFKESPERMTKLTKVERPKENFRNVDDKEPTNPIKEPRNPIKEPDKKSRDLTCSKSSLSSFSRQSSWKEKAPSRLRSYNSVRLKERPKISYDDDLSSTLSADVGDSSFVRTSGLFNPEIYKKPYVFTRSASERWTRQQSNTFATKIQDTYNPEDKPQHTVEEDKVLRKLSENICATQDKDTKFQDYGLVDCVPDNVPANTEHNPGSERRFSHINPETSHSHRKPFSGTKDRPISWSEETNEWLQKKRQEYNLANKKLNENKENLKCNTVIEKSDKKKRFTIFR